MKHLVFILITLYIIAYKICEILEKYIITLYNYYVDRITNWSNMKDLIYMEQEQINKFDSLQKLYEFIFGKQYFNLTEKQKFIRRYEIAFYKIKFYCLDLDIVHTKMGILGEQYKVINEKYNLEKALIIDSEREFVMSLCKIPNITILESKSSNNLLTAKEKEKIFFA